MRLQKIKLAGFKSFVDPTVFPLPSNLVGIVGPNGCGKSNIIDAVRWVMGEASAKNLRGGSMTDVIFTGSSARKPIGQAFVELVFDNSDHSLGGEWADYNEIAIKRLLSRDGQSHYFLNGTRCRRRDITDIFLGTGLGPRSYAIIEQGMISRLIEARPEDLRIFLEEAAGISRYKERRRETETRIGHTRENLARLQDVRGELEKQLGHLQRQAKTAEKYQKLNQQLQQTQAETLALKLRQLEQESSHNQQQIQRQAVEVEANLSAQRTVETRLVQLHTQQQESNQQLHNKQAEFYQQTAEVSRLEQMLHHQADLKQRLTQELAQLQQSWQDIQQLMQADQQTLSRLQAQCLEDQALQQAVDSEMQWAEDRLEAVEQAQLVWQEQWERLNHALIEPRRLSEIARTQMTQIEQQIQRLEQRLQALQQEVHTVSAPQLAEEVALLQAQLEDQAMGLEQYREQQQIVAEQITTAHQHQRLLVQDVSGLQAEAAGVAGQYAALTALQAEAMHLTDNPALARWLESHSLAKSERLLSGLVVAPGWELAVEMVLGFMLEAVCVESLPKRMDDEADLPAGLTLLAYSEAMPSPSLTVSLASKVQTHCGRIPGLDQVWAADDLAQALQLQSSLEPHQSVMTRQGIWLGPNWLRIAVESGSTQHSNRIQRQQQLQTLETRQQAIADELAVVELQQQAQQRQILAYQQQQEQLQQHLQHQQRQYHDWQVQLSARQAKLEQIQQRQQAITHDIAQIKTQLQQDTADHQTASQQLYQALEQLDILAQQRQALEPEREQHRSQLQSAREAVDTLRSQAQTLALQLESATSQQRTMQQQQQRLQAQALQLQERSQQISSQIAEHETPNTDLQQQLEQALGQHQRLEAQAQEIRQQAAEIEQHQQQAEREKQQWLAQGQGLQHTLEQQRRLQQEYQVRWQVLAEEFAKTEMVLAELWQTLPAEAVVATWQAQAEQLAVKIKALGAVNLAAIEEYAALQERQRYLDSQYQDLEEALKTLEAAIHKMDKETRQRFQQTFTAVNERIQVLFPQLFGGGNAYLELTGDNLLEAGVTIMARPPGKRNSTIHALSGGEKALTAVSLVFAIFELNPAPFCMLDEVDAPLDEANVGRFCELVRMMSERVQFIFITHNKVTMELAKQLTGVTMQEPGVSRLVAVDVDRAVQMVGAAV